MLFAFIPIDRPGSAALRARVRPEHKADLTEVADRVAFAGPLVDDDGAICGSLLVLDFADRDAALDWLDNEPFTRVGLYLTRAVHGFRNLWPQTAGLPQS